VKLYRVGLDITESQKKELKQLALERDTSVQSLVTSITLDEIQKAKADKIRKQKEDKQN